MSKGPVTTYDIGRIGRMDGTAIGDLIRKGELNKEEVVDDVVRRASFADQRVNCLVTKALDRKVWSQNAVNAVFEGVPTFIKDLTDVRDFPTLYGTRAVSKAIKKKNNKTVDQILSTGTVILGKSTTSEFGLLPCTETLVTGDTLNPVNTQYSTGGSSGGAGALVASGVVPFAHAEDGGGSIRIPAACCGLVGLKPTRNRHIDAPTKSLPIHITCHGIVSRSVRDTANYYHAIEAYHRNKDLPEIGLVTGPSKRRLRIGMFTETGSGIDSHPDVSAAVLKAAKVCEENGHHVDYIPCPYPQQFKIDFMIYYSFLSLMARRFGKVAYDPQFKSDLVEPFTKGFGNAFSLLSVVGAPAIYRLRKFIHHYKKQFQNYDLLLSPVLSSVVPKIGHFDPRQDFKIIIERLNNYTNFTMIQNATGAPAISLPIGECQNGLPIGVQFAALPGEERKLIEMAFELEASNAFMPFP